MDGEVYAPVDNEKLRLVVRIQRGKNDYEYITNVNIDQYAHWDGEGKLKVNVPDDLTQGRLLVEVRPNFTDVATQAIAERWSVLLTAEVVTVKDGMKNLDTSKVLFPINDEAHEYLSTESKFTTDEIFKKVNSLLENEHEFAFPVVVKDITLKKDDLVSYIFLNSPRAGRVISIEHKDNQTFVLLSPELLDIYKIPDINDSKIIEEGLLPENVILREGDRLVTDKNESDPTKFEPQTISGKKKKKKVKNFKKNCKEGDAIFTYQDKLSFFPFNPTSTSKNQPSPISRDV